MENDMKFWCIILAEVFGFFAVVIAMCAVSEAYDHALAAKAASPLEYACAISSARVPAPACLVLRK